MTISAHNICKNNGKVFKPNRAALNYIVDPAIIRLRRSTQAALCTTYAKLM